MIFIRRFRSHWSMNVVGEAYTTLYPLLINKHLSSLTYQCQPPPQIKQSSFSMYRERCGMGICIIKTRRSVEHCILHADGAWLNELGWSQY